MSRLLAFDLQSGNWQPIGAIGGRAYGPTEFIDPEPATHPQGFYRVLPSL